MIILNEAKKEQVKGIYNDKELNPIEIKGNLYILPEIVLKDKDYPLEILKQCEIREVDKSEFIKADIDF